MLRTDGHTADNVKGVYSSLTPIPADSRRAVVSFWRKNVHNTGQPLRGLSLSSKRVVR